MTLSDPSSEGRVPDAVLALSKRLGCVGRSPNGYVELRQSGQMRQDKASSWMPFDAHQRIEATRCAFDWNARTGPLKLVHVRDAFDGSRGALSVKLFGVLPIVRPPHSPELDRGELLRYLAELAWAPAAILSNPNLAWRVESEKHLIVTTGEQPRQAEIRLTLDEEGLIVEAYAKDRPRAIRNRLLEAEWRGVFSKYQRREGRLIPTSGEVGWIVKGEYEPVWRGDLVAWRAA